MTTPAESSPRTGSSLATHLVPLRRNSGWLMAAGIALIILGVLTIELGSQRAAKKREAL